MRNLTLTRRCSATGRWSPRKQPLVGDPDSQQIQLDKLMSVKTLHNAVVLVATLLASMTAAGENQFGSRLKVSDLNGKNGFAILGASENDNVGSKVSAAGDVNADGFADIILSAPGASPNSNSEAGVSYVIFGGESEHVDGALDLIGLNGKNGFAITGVDAMDFSGISVSGGGDLNDDGIDDLLIGARGGDPNGLAEAGESYVIFGQSEIGAGGVFNLSQLDGSNGFVINGIDERDSSGEAISFLGDVNADGVDDMIVGSPLADPQGRPLGGETYVIFGGESIGRAGSFELADLNGMNGFRIIGSERNDLLGRAVSRAGDFNGDGIDDIILGAKNAGNDGQSYVIFGSAGIGAGGEFDLRPLSGTDGIVIEGATGNARGGSSVGSAGDINGDGVGDIVIGVDTGGNDENDTGRSYVMFGSVDISADRILPLFPLDGTTGFVIHGKKRFDGLGFSATGRGDFNADGISDLLVSAPGAGEQNEGEAYMIFGGPGIGAGGALDPAMIDRQIGFVVTGVTRLDNLGVSVSYAGDMNGDGIDDVVIGSSRTTSNNKPGAGAAFVVFGHRSIPEPSTVVLSLITFAVVECFRCRM